MQTAILLLSAIVGAIVGRGVHAGAGVFAGEDEDEDGDGDGDEDGGELCKKAVMLWPHDADLYWTLTATCRYALY